MRGPILFLFTLLFTLRPLHAVMGEVPSDHWARNLAPNPGFETDANNDGTPDGWLLPPEQCVWAADTKHSGTRSLRYANADKQTYRLIMAPVSVIPGVAYHVSAMVRGQNVHDGDAFSQGAGVCIEYYDAKGKWMGGAYPPCRSGTFDWTRVGGDTPPVQNGAASGRIVLYLRKHNTGTAWFDDVIVKAVRGPAIQVRLLRPGYRATITSPTAGKSIEVLVRPNRREYALPDTMRIEGELHDASGKRFAAFDPPGMQAQGDEVTITWPLPALPRGRLLLTVRLEEPNGKDIAKASVPLRVAEPIERRVYVDKQKRLIAEGKPFFPLGIYLGPTEDEHLARIARAGFNTILCYGYGQGKNPRAYLDRAQKHGLRVIYSIKDLYEGSKYYRPRGGLSDIETMRKCIDDLRDHPAILAWYTNDELSPTWLPKLQT
ncbi:hypothetical protein HQ560_16955, partial [bacterium]|nr:hypothetical protein [bacterium]